MSTSYRSLTPLRFEDLFGDALAACGLREVVDPRDTTPTARCLSDGTNFLWIYADEAGFVSVMVRCKLLNAVDGILSAIEEAFGVEIVSEHQPQFWSFVDQEVWDKAQREIARKQQDAFYADLLLYVANQPNGIRPGTIGEQQAQIARELAEKDPLLLLPESRDALLDHVEGIWSGRHAVKVTLTPQEVELAHMIGLSPTSLPQA